MADKYLALVTGEITEIEASVIGGGEKAGEIPALDGAGRLDSTMMPVGIAPEIVTCNAGEALAAGDLINLYLDSTLKARKADASLGYKADGYVLAGVDMGDPATVYLEGIITGLGSLTLGAKVWLGDAGALVEAAALPATAGDIIQPVGKVTVTGAGTTEVIFEPKNPITIA